MLSTKISKPSKRYVSQTSEDDKTSAVTKPYGIRDSEQPSYDVVSIPDQCTIRQQTEDLCGEGDNDQALTDDLDPILDPIRKEYEVKVQLGSPLKNKKLATIVNNLYSETMEDKKLKNLLKKYNKPENCPYVFAPNCNPEIWNKNLTTVLKGHDIGLQKIQMHSVKAAYAITENWKKITNDHIILNIIRYGFKINFKEKPQYQNVPKIPHDMLETEIITQEVKKLLNKGVIVECSRETGDFASTVFTKQKKDGTFRTILNLKYLNEFVQYQHFKMESLLDAFKIVKPSAWMASIDLKDAFFTVPIHESHQKYFKFEWIDKVYKFVGMPNGYSDAMQIFTKILKPLYGNLKQKGHLSVVFVDDSYLQRETECLRNVEATIALLEYLGFTIHEAKSILKPTQQIEFLGFMIVSTKMTATISKDKMIAITNKIKRFMATTFPTIRQLASVIGSVIFLFSAVPLGKLHYTALEKHKTVALNKASGNFDKIAVKISVKAIELNWW